MAILTLQKAWSLIAFTKAWLFPLPIGVADANSGRSSKYQVDFMLGCWWLLVLLVVLVISLEELLEEELMIRMSVMVMN